MHSKIKPWKETGRRPLLDCRVFAIEATTSESPADGKEHEYYRITCNDWVQIVPVTRNDEIVMVWQYRHGSSEMSLEVPAGLIDPNEDPRHAAMRECLEETGYEAKSPIYLGSLRPNPAYFSNHLHAYYALDVERIAEIRNTGTEETEVELVKVDDVAELMRQGKIDHALAVAVLWRFLQERK